MHAMLLNGTEFRFCADFFFIDPDPQSDSVAARDEGMNPKCPHHCNNYSTQDTLALKVLCYCKDVSLNNNERNSCSCVERIYFKLTTILPRFPVF